MKKTLCLACIVSTSFFLSGCWDYSPLGNNYIITGVGIDVDQASPDKILVSFVGPAQTKSSGSSSSGASGSSTQQNSYSIVSSSGESIRSAATDAQNKTGQNLSVNNLRVIVFSEDVARKGISIYLDSFLRNVQINSNTLILVTEGTAKELLSFKSEDISRIPMYLIDLVSSTDYQTKPDFCTLKEVTYALNSKYKAFVIPYIILNPKEKEITYKNICLFKEDKMIDILSESESIAYFLLSGIFKKDEYVLDSEHTDNITKEGSSFNLFSEKRKINANITNGQATFDLMFRLRGETTEQVSINIMMNSETSQSTNEFDSLQKKDDNKISSLIKLSITKVLKKLQTEHKVDSIGFGEYVRVKYPDYFKKISWDEEFQKANFNIDVEVDIKKCGIIKSE